MERSKLNEKYEWQRKGKKYRTKYLAALEQLFGYAIKDNPEAKVKRSSDGHHPKGQD